MALTHAILALLLDNPCSGYDLAKDFDRSVNFFWRATHQQIYRELAKLEDQQFVTVEAIVQTGRPDKKLYSITDAGKAHLTEWMTQPCDVMPIKEDLLVKLWAGVLIEPTALREELERHRQLHREKLAVFETIAQQFPPDVSDMPIAQKYQYLVLRRGIHYETEYLHWCDEALALIS